MPSAAYHQNPSAYFEASAYRGFDLAQPATGLVLFGRIALMPRKQTPRNDLKHRSIAAPYSAPLAAVEFLQVGNRAAQSFDDTLALSQHQRRAARGCCTRALREYSDWPIGCCRKCADLQALRARMCAKSSSASAASLAKASTSGSVATRTEFVDASAISRASASLWAAHPRNARPRRRGQGDTHCGLSVFYRHPSGDRCSFGRCGGSQRFCVRWPCSGRRLFLIVFDAAKLNNLMLDNLVLGATWPRNFLLHGTPLEFNNLALDEALRSATQDGAQFATILRDAGKRPYRAGFLMRRFERRSVQARRSFF